MQHTEESSRARLHERSTKPTLLVLELWGLGDLALATPFLKAASQKYNVTLLAKPHAVEMQPRFWPDVRVIPFTAPWTRFFRKYNLLTWNWKELLSTIQKIRRENFDAVVSARWDPRDHFLMRIFRAKKRVGFPRSSSQIFLSNPLARPLNENHRYEYWRTLGRDIWVELPSRHQKEQEHSKPLRSILIHSGAARAVRVWPLERVRGIAHRLRSAGLVVRIACDPSQQDWWRGQKEDAISPANVNQLMDLLDASDLFIGNDSGPGHVAAAAGVPTFTIFGPQLPELFLPIHPMAGFAEGKPCPYKPCFDQCHYPIPHCIVDLAEAEVWVILQKYLSHFEPFSTDAGT